MKIIICDDEQEALTDMEKMITYHMKDMYPDIPLEILTFSEEYSVQEYLEEKDDSVDAVFMDIYLKDENGIQVAKKILEEYSHIKILFFTGVIEYAADIFEIDPFYFLVKPVPDEKLRDALRRLAECGKEEEEKFLTIKTIQNITRIPQNDIWYIESEGRYVIIKMADREITSIAKLEDIVGRLSDQFIRCHKSYLVNRNEIQNFEYTKLVLADGTEIPISKNYRSSVKRAIIDCI